MKNKKDMIKWLNNLKSDIGQPQNSQLWHYAEILDVVVKYLEVSEVHGEWVSAGHTNGLNGTCWAECSICGSPGDLFDNYCRVCGADMRGEKHDV